MFRAHVPTCEVGRILGHEGVGVVEEIGAAVASLNVGDHVLISCITSCGKCEYCRKGMYSHCTTGGWILGKPTAQLVANGSLALIEGQIHD